MNPETIKSLIAHQFGDAQIEVSGAEGKFTAEIISTQFEGLNTLKRHRLVYATVNAEIASGALHALTIVAKTPAEAQA